MPRVKKAISDLLRKIGSKESDYEESLEQRQEKLISLQAELAEKAIIERDHHKAFVLGQITEEAYQDIKSKSDKLKISIAELQKEMKLIETYKTEDVDELLKEIKSKQPELNAEVLKEITGLRYELQQAKHDYLQKMLTVREKYSKAMNEKSKLEQLYVKLGHQPQLYLSNAYEGVGSTLTVDQTMVYDALTSGQIDAETSSLVKKGIDNGYIR